MIAPVQSALDQLWAAQVIQYSFDLLRRQISFELEVQGGEEVSHFALEFRRVSAFYFVNNIGDTRFDIPEVEEGDFLELTSLSFVAGGIGVLAINPDSAAQGWSQKLLSRPAFILEIWESWLLIESSAVSVNGVEFPVVEIVTP